MIEGNINSALRLVDREIWIVTAPAADGRRGGMTAHYTAELVAESETFAAHLLRPDQSAVAWNFVNGSGRDRDKLAGLATNTGARGTPILADCLAWLECRRTGSFTAVDRVFYVADVIAGEQVASGEPLRENAFIASLSDSQRRQLAASKAADLEQVRSRRR
jgi:flavin reductase (DIM6/NTAB) family NADH-FMN oxidoreductase RutF